jgi:probable F420-dependent oxidoreductase
MPSSTGRNTGRIGRLPPIDPCRLASIVRLCEKNLGRTEPSTIEQIPRGALHMRVGVVFPQTESGRDPGFIREYTQATEELGFTHILAYDHVLGASTKDRPDWSGPYTSESLFHEPFVLFGYMAALTETLEFVTGVIISPQRQTALLAKQAAEVDLLAGGRFRLGIGVGWNEIEYIGLNENFRNRGKREEEQIDLMRRLWTEDVIDYTGAYHRIPEAGLNPLPVQRPIPIWLGGKSEVAYRRAARLADGWMPQFPPTAQGIETVARVRQYVEEAGRNPDEFGIEARITMGDKTPDVWRNEFEGWRQLNASHLSVNTMKMGLENPAAHIDALRRFADEMGIGKQ